MRLKYFFKYLKIRNLWLTPKEINLLKELEEYKKNEKGVEKKC